MSPATGPGNPEYDPASELFNANVAPGNWAAKGVVAGSTLNPLATVWAWSALKSQDVDPGFPISMLVTSVSTLLLTVRPKASFALTTPAVMVIWAKAGTNAAAHTHMSTTLRASDFMYPPGWKTDDE